MKKTIKLSESQLKKVIEKIVGEQNYMNVPNKDLNLYGKTQKGKQTRQYYKPNALATRYSERTNIEANKLIFTQQCNQPWTKNTPSEVTVDVLESAIKKLNKALVGKWIEPICHNSTGKDVGPVLVRITGISPYRRVSSSVGYFGGGGNTYSFESLEIKTESPQDKTFAVNMWYPIGERQYGAVKQFQGSVNNLYYKVGQEQNLLNFLNCFFANGWPQDQPQTNIQESNLTKLIRKELKKY